MGSVAMRYYGGSDLESGLDEVLSLAVRGVWGVYFGVLGFYSLGFVGLLVDLAHGVFSRFHYCVFGSFGFFGV